MSWTQQIGSSVTGGGTFSALGLGAVISKDGLVIAYAERSDNADENSPFVIRVRRRVGAVWQNFGTFPAAFNTSIVINNANLFSLRTDQIVSLSANGHIIAIGDYTLSGNNGQVRILEYNSDTDTWDPRGLGSTIPGITPGERFGYTVDLSGDATHLIASVFNPFGTDGSVRVFGYSEITGGWQQINTFNILDVGTTLGLSVSLNYDGTTFAIGNPLGPSATGTIEVWRKADPTDFSPAAYSPLGFSIDNGTGTSLINNGEGLGNSIDLDDSGNRLVIGASGADAGVGGAKVYQYTTGPSWIDYGNVVSVDAVNDSRFGTVVSIDSAGERISVSSAFSTVTGTPNVGFTRVLDLVGSTWTVVGSTITTGEADAYPVYSRLSGSGKKIVSGATGTNPGVTGNVRVLTLNPEVEVYDNTFDQEGSNDFSPSVNPITELGARGLDNDPNGLPLTFNSTDLLNPGVSFSPFASLSANPFFGVSGDPRETFTKRASLDGKFLYLREDGEILYDTGAINPPVTPPSFRYTATNGTTSSPEARAATVTFNLTIGPLTLDPNPPPTIVVTRNANSNPGVASISNGGGAVFIDGGVLPYTSVPDPATARGELIVTMPNVVEFFHNYQPNFAFNTLGNFVDTIDVDVTDSQPVTTTTTFTINTTINPELMFASSPSPSYVQEVGQTPTTNALTGVFGAIGGSPQPSPVYSFGITGGIVDGTDIIMIGQYGDLTITNTATGAYQYDPNKIPTTSGNYTDSFTINLSDVTGDSKTLTFNVSITIFQATQTFSLIPIADQGMVIKSEGGTLVIQTGLTGTLMVVPGSGIVQEYGVQGGTSAGNDRFITTSNGLFTIDSVTGEYTYQVTVALGNTATMFEDSFVLTAISTLGAMTTTLYKVTFEIRPQMLLGNLSPSAGAICRNTQLGSTDVIGLSGFIVPVVQNSIGNLTYTIDGGNQVTPFIQSKPGTLGDLFVNIVTGEYFIDPNSISLPNNPGVYLDQFTIRVTDSDTPAPNEQTLIYNMSATVNDTPIGLLPVFRHSTSREITGYWNFIIHSDQGSTTQTITQSGNITVPNTEILVVGQTETTGDPFRDADEILRQLLGSAAYDRTNPGDVLINIKNDTQDVLDADNVDGVQTRSVQLSRVSGGKLETFIAELSDVLSSQHSNFLLNRYRSNVGETVVVIYANDALNNFGTVTTILNQIKQLTDLGTRTVIGLMMAATLDPNVPAEKTSLENSQASFLNLVRQTIGDSTIVVNSVITRYDGQRYLNVAGSNANPSTSPEITFNVPNFSSFNLYGALTRISLIPQDNLNPNLRIVIKSVDLTRGEATGDVVYGKITSSNTTFTSSRLFNDSTREVVAGSVFTDFEGLDIASGQVVEITLRQGSTGKNVTALKPGDVLYSANFAYQKPVSATLLISVVSGFKDANVANQDLFLQIDDGVRFPNNPVFRARTTATPIIRKFNSNTLEQVTPTDNSIEFGFDYEIEIEDLDTALAAGGLERYVDFPRLGFVTLYFASNDQDQPIYNAYGRGAIKVIFRS